MKWMICTIASLALFAARAHAEADFDDTDADTGRLGYISVDSTGATTLTFNATSIQNAVILGLFLLVLGALLLPLLGVTMDGFFGGAGGTGYGYGYEQPSNGYEDHSSGYSTYAKRSLETLGPVVDALAKAHKKYNE